MTDFKVGDEVIISTPLAYHTQGIISHGQGSRGVVQIPAGEPDFVDEDGDVWVNFSEDPTRSDDYWIGSAWVSPECLSLDIPASNPIEPNHYQRNGVNFIEFIEHMPGNRFNAMKYIYRAGEKNPETLLEDLKKGQWSLNREIERVERDAANSRD